ncbi:MAG: glycosyltransferase family 2 protein [Bacteroidaceae bacterium]|nr:glycosyltransferase family 2 protein [Bacteroidaceae bacterium]
MLVKILFWLSAFIVFYTFFGYGILVWIIVRIKEALHKPETYPVTEEFPMVTLLIAAYNEQDYIEEKMKNCRAIDYPKDRLKIVWVTDGSTDRTPELLSQYPENTVYHKPERCGKTAALNRVMEFVDTPYVVMTDANTYLNPESIYRLIRKFDNPKVGCVAGEKKVMTDGESAAAAEGVYWKYESFLKDLDDRLYSSMGAAGELIAIRRELWIPIPAGVLGDDLNISLNMLRRGYIIGYCKEAYAMEKPSADIKEERKRKVRLAANGYQISSMFRDLMNPFKYGVIAFQFVSHRVIRWILTPSTIILMFLLNIALVAMGAGTLYTVLLVLQVCFYLAALAGMALDRKGKSGILRVPYYFLFANFTMFPGLKYYLNFNGNAAWEKSRRA